LSLFFHLSFVTVVSSAERIILPLPFELYVLSIVPAITHSSQHCLISPTFLAPSCLFTRLCFVFSVYSL
jgi:hypothetical protein